MLDFLSADVTFSIYSTCCYCFDPKIWQILNAVFGLSKAVNDEFVILA